MKKFECLGEFRMDKASSLQIETMEVLLRYMQEKELSVEWTVYSDIGPGWIGGSRTICFYLDEHPLHDNSFHERLQRSVIAFANIAAQIQPESGKKIDQQRRTQRDEGHVNEI